MLRGKGSAAGALDTNRETSFYFYVVTEPVAWWAKKFPKYYSFFILIVKVSFI